MINKVIRLTTLAIIITTYTNIQTMNLTRYVLAGNEEEVKKALENGEDPSKDYANGNNALHFAAMKGKLKIAEMILNHCKSKKDLILKKNSSKNTPIDLANTAKRHELAAHLKSILEMEQQKQIEALKQKKKLDEQTIRQTQDEKKGKKKTKAKTKRRPRKKRKQKTQFHIPYKPIVFMCTAAILLYCLVYSSQHTNN